MPSLDRVLTILVAPVGAFKFLKEEIWKINILFTAENLPSKRIDRYYH